MMGGVGRVTSAKKNSKIFKLIFFKDFFFAWNLTLSDFYTRNDSLGFEDCRLATHLLNLSGRFGDRVNQIILLRGFALSRELTSRARVFNISSYFVHYSVIHFCKLNQPKRASTYITSTVLMDFFYQYD